MSNYNGRIWTLKEGKETINEGRRNGYKVTSNNGIVKVIDNNTLVVSLMIQANNTYLVRYNRDYFENE